MTAQVASTSSPQLTRWSLAHRLWHSFNAILMVLIVLTLVAESALGRLHVPVGLLLGAAFLWRLVLFVFANDREVWTSAVQHGREAMKILKGPKENIKKNLPTLHKGGLKVAHASFFGLLAIQITSGIAMVGFHLAGQENGLTHFFKECHEVSGWLIFIFMAAHIAGVIRAEMTEEPGIISNIIRGPQNEST